MDNEALKIKLKAEREAGEEYQRRRHTQWKDTYNLYRDIVETNSLTQRQEVNIPIMKETKKTLLSRIDDAPDIKFYCLDNDKKTIDAKTKEININELWLDDADRNNYEAIDILEKNNVLLFGRALKKLNWENGRVITEVVDNLDVLIDPKTNPKDIDTARYIIHLHIKKTISEILNDPKYDEEGKEYLKQYASPSKDNPSQGHIIEGAETYNRTAKEEEQQDLGIVEKEKLDGYEQEIELNEHFTYIWDEKKKEYVKYVCTTALNEEVILRKKPLKEAMGIDDFWTWESWADDLDAKDFWSDGVGDTVRVPNKVINIYFSQMIENRAYRNLGMKWYLPVPGFNPQTYEPEPFGMYSAPLVKDTSGRYMTVEQVIRDMQIPALEDNLVSIDFLIKLIERTTAATAYEKGVGEKKQITLGEVESLMQKSAQTIASMAKFYRHSWKRFAEKWLAIYQANMNEEISLYKKSSKGYYEKKIRLKDIKSDKGYKVIARSSAEQEGEETKTIQKMIAIKAQMPNNMALAKVVEKRLLDVLDLTPEEMQEIESEQTNLQNNQMANPPVVAPQSQPQTAMPQ